MLEGAAEDAERSALLRRGGPVGLFMRMGDVLKCDKSIWWMPWRQEAMKDVALCDKLRGGESTL